MVGQKTGDLEMNADLENSLLAQRVQIYRRTGGRPQSLAAHPDRKTIMIRQMTARKIRPEWSIGALALALIFVGLIVATIWEW